MSSASWRAQYSLGQYNIDSEVITLVAHHKLASTNAPLLVSVPHHSGDSQSYRRPQEGLFGLKEWEDEGFVPDPVPTAGLVLPAAIVGPNSKRLRGASTRVHSKPHL